MSIVFSFGAIESSFTRARARTHTHTHTHKYIKVKMCLFMPWKHSGNGGLASLSVKIGIRRRWVVSLRPQTLWKRFRQLLSRRMGGSQGRKLAISVCLPETDPRFLDCVQFKRYVSLFERCHCKYLLSSAIPYRKLVGYVVRYNI